LIIPLLVKICLNSNTIALERESHESHDYSQTFGGEDYDDERGASADIEEDDVTPAAISLALSSALRANKVSLSDFINQLVRNNSASSVSTLQQEEKKGQIIDLAANPTTKPTANELTNYIPKGLFNSDWSVCSTQTSRDRISPARAAFTKYTSSVAQHPYLERFITVNPLGLKDISKKKEACSVVANSIYHILWHARVKFPGIAVKSKEQTLSTQAPSPAESRTGIVEEITKHLIYAIRHQSQARRN
jgi:hypothetical protein